MPDTWREQGLLSLVGEVQSLQLLQNISEILKRLVEAASHGVAESEIAAYRYLSLAVGERRARSIWNPHSGICNADQASTPASSVAENASGPHPSGCSLAVGVPRVKSRKMVSDTPTEHAEESRSRL
jgi:hypothetical protein